MAKTNLQEKYYDWAIETQLRPIEWNYFEYHITFAQYVERGIFLLEKNDKGLEKHLKDNGVHIHDMDDVIERLLVEHSDEKWIAYNILCILDYLKWSYNINVDYRNINVFKFKREPKIQPKENKVINIIQYRNLSSLRKALIEKHKKCQICGIRKEKLLRQSHLKPRNISEKEEKKYEIFDINNVLLLCRNHDGAIDEGLITFNDGGKISISRELHEEDVKKLGLNETIKIELEEEQKKYMKYHRDNVFRK